MKKNKLEKEVLVETRKNEILLTTTDTADMLNKYLAKSLSRAWFEDFVDEESGEVVSIERSEIISPKGSFIDGDLLSEINFLLLSGDIKEVVVSNQARLASHVNCGVQPWSVSAIIGNKKHRFLLYANSIQMALDIAKDYIELTYEGPFQILNVKDFNSCIIIKEQLKPKAKDGDEYQESPEIKFYQIEVRVHRGDYNYKNTFVIRAIDVDSAMIVINDWLSTSIKERALKDGVNGDTEFTTSVESAVVIPCSRTIEQAFTTAYMKEEKDYQ